MCVGVDVAGMVGAAGVVVGYVVVVDGGGVVIVGGGVGVVGYVYDGVGAVLLCWCWGDVVGESVVFGDVKCW